MEYSDSTDIFNSENICTMEARRLWIFLVFCGVIFADHVLAQTHEPPKSAGENQSAFKQIIVKRAAIFKENGAAPVVPGNDYLQSQISNQKLSFSGLLHRAARSPQGPPDGPPKSPPAQLNERNGPPLQP